MNQKWRGRLAVVGILLILLAPPFFWRTCDDLGVDEPTTEGIEIIGFTGFTITYAIDEVRVCTVGMGPVFFIVGVGTLGYLFINKPQ
ncbi:hypothetical protein [Haladaptatus sp. ZSTT2]|uniref:hypothetical protein n=1 Tax=Haladaptatus sp. ZSTT2 TaxID=3120515 RepID=UPI00300EAA23